MKAVVLAGGYATRMWPITKDRPKMFLPVGDGTVIDIIFQDLEADNRVDEVFVSTNERFADDFESYIESSSYEKPTLSVEDTSEEDEKFGVVGALEQLIDRENVSDDLVVVAGDNLLSFDLSEFVDFFESKQTPCLAAYDVGSKDRASSYGLVQLDDDQVIDFQEKPDNPQSTLVSIACYAFPAETLPNFETYLADGNNPDEPGWLMQWLQNRGSVHAFTFDGAWFDIGTPESYLDAVSWYLDGETFIDDTATVEDSTLGNNVHLMAGASVVDSELERTVVFENTNIDAATVSDSVIDEESSIEAVDLTETLVGSYSQIRQ
ncbi:sugar phosphate nucleotidyltransferase [Haloquadratum walsbyi]|jgi:glucose-1-phosphate thymidylyltransferase|uniref:Sugar nucleotidyltransferase n=2 Tax=Haloquadratum walsbyi TaxID=293091 RepID=Q18JK8_HALWD|nr:NDP-sugar synthase [Haloquadratum walsbyi]CAJ51798.1 sugar nucleotidyltransferase [Haloquadratum walsbyi DSM 16790]CCC39716.1 sugar nucleotidyltransferase [Haloquadratum walsbyi C23]